MANSFRVDYFWIICAVAVGGFIGFVFSPVLGLSITLACVLSLFLLHLRRLRVFLMWLETDTVQPPAGLGSIWTEIAMRIMKARRKKEKSNAKLRDKEQQFAQTINSLPDGVILVRPHWEIELVNPPAERNFGINALTDTGRPIYEVFKNQQFKEYLESGNWDESLVLTPKDGRRLEIRAFPAGKKYYVIVSRDETEPMRLDAMRRDFVANVSHELRTPLTVIKGFLELQEDRPEITEEEKLHMKMMSDQAERMGILVDDLLALSRLERDSAPAAKQPVSVRELMSDIAEQGRVLSQGRHTIELGQIQSGYILCDPKEMMSAISNLVTNAVRYTPEGGKVVLRYYVDEDGGNIEVEDNGIGISEEDIPRVTERFYRVDKSRSRETGGTGLGLAIVKHVLFRHQAQLEINSELGKGSIFRIVLPPARLKTNPAESN